MDRRRLITGYALAAAGAAMFSSKAIFIKLAYIENADAVMMLALRMAVALPFFVVIGLIAAGARHRSGQSMPGLTTTVRALLTGFIGYYLAALLDFQGLVYISAQLERLVLFTYPVFVMVLGWAFFGGRLTAGALLAAAVAYAGLAIVFGADLPAGGRNTVIGTALVAAAALAFALYQLLAKRFIAAMGSMLFTSLALSASAVACIVHYALASGGLAFDVSTRYLLLAAATGIFATVLPSFLVNAGLARIGPQSTAMISTLSPLLTIYFAVVFLNEPFTLPHAAGTLLVIGGIGLYGWADIRNSQSS